MRGRQVGRLEVACRATRGGSARACRGCGRAGSDRPLVVVRRGEPALSGHQVLRRVQAEHRGSELAGTSPVVARAVGLGCVLDDRDPVPLRDARRAESMSAIRPYRWTGMIAFVRGVIAASTRSGSMQKSSSRTSTNTGPRSRQEDRADRRVEGEADRDHLVARPDAQRPQDRLERDRAVGHEDRVPDAAVVGPGCLELVGALAHREHARSAGRSSTASSSAGPMSGIEIGITGPPRPLRACSLALDPVGRTTMRTHGRSSLPHTLQPAPLRSASRATTGADPPDPPRRVARDECVGRNVAGHDGARADRREPSDVVAGYDDRPGPDRCPVSDADRAHDPVVRRGRARRSAVIERGYRSLVRMAFGPMNTPSSTVTPWYTSAAFWILTRSPMPTPSSMKASRPTTHSAPICAPRRICARCQIARPRADDDVGLELRRWMHARGWVDHGPPR